MADLKDQQLDKTIREHLPKLRKPGVLTVRPGYEISGGQLTGKRAIVATVHTKLPHASLAASDALPEKVAGIPVDVRQASPYQRLRATDPLAAELSHAYGRPEDAEPSWPLEREVDSGKRLSASGSQAQQRLQSQRSLHRAADKALSAHQSKPQLKYQPDHTCPPLQAMDITATITTAVSPDCGFATLQGFLAGTAEALKIGMYDFTSGPILALFEKDLAAPRTLQMVLDSPAPNDTRDQTDWMTVQDLQQSLGKRASIARALTRGDRFATQWSFPSAYHIKVIVRDGTALWLSSGNLNNSNEPAPNHPKTTQDRDWHVIIDHAALAKVFAAYLDFDYRTAESCQAPAPADIEKAIEDAQQKKQLQTDPPKPPAATPPPATSAKPQTFKNLALNVTPLLTPDTLPGGTTGQYLGQMMALIAAAKTSIHIQLQYIESSDGTGDVYDQLLKAIAKRIADGLEVYLIVAADYAQKWGEKMKDGKSVDLTANIRTQPHVHNKGFVIDSETVVVSSQNFSPQGVSQNRDAGVILRSKDIAAYFEPIFLADWQRALPFVAHGGAGTTAKKKVAAKKKPASKTTAAKKPRGKAKS